MGIYLLSLDADEWFSDDEEEGFGELASALDAELARRGLPPFDGLPGPARFERGSGLLFEEKLSSIPDEGFAALCEEHLTEEEAETLCGWTVLVPLSLEEEIWLPASADVEEETMVAGAPQVLVVAERLAELLQLPLDEIPATSDNLDLTAWFSPDEAGSKLAARRPGPWAEDLDTAFHVAVHLRAAQHALRRNCPIVWT